MTSTRLSMCMLLAASLFPAVSWAQSRVGDFQLGGSAHVLDEECIRLTPDRPYVSGSAWFSAAIDLNQPFEMRLSLVLGAKDSDGADGIVFVFHPAMATGRQGEGMGFAGLVPSLGIEFDTYQNAHLNDPVVDHMALMINGQRYHGTSAHGPVALGNLEDATRHPLRIRWSPEVGQLQIFLDEELKAAYSADLVRSVFGGHSTVYWGMTAATGRLSNDQDVCIEKVFIGA